MTTNTASLSGPAHPERERWPSLLLGVETRARLFWAVLAFLLVCFCAASATTLIELRRDAWGQAAASSRNLALALSQEVGHDLRTYDALMLRTLALLRDPGFTRLDPAQKAARLLEGAYADAFLADVFVTDTTGKVTWDRNAISSGTRSVEDTSFFKVHRANRDEGLFIGEPFARTDNASDRVAPLSRRLEAADGSFAGTLVALVRMEFFGRILRGSVMSPDDSISLFTQRGILLARVPERPELIGQDMSQSPNVSRILAAEAGVFTGRSAIDDVQRIYNFVHVKDAPMALTVALAEETVFASWNRRAMAIGLVLLLLCGLTLTLAVLIRREFRRRVETEIGLRRSEEQYRLLADHSTDLIIRLDAGMTRRYVSPASRPMLGFEPAEILGDVSYNLIHPDDWPEVRRLAANARKFGGGTEAAYRLRNKAGDYIWVEGRYNYIPADGGFIVVLRNITKRRKVEEELTAAHAELTALVNTDPLTGLANRRRFDEELDNPAAPETGTTVSLLMIDIDRFKLFNDRYGHPAGDECLRAVAAAIRSALPDVGALAMRIGGEEMAVLLPGRDLSQAQTAAERIREAVEALAIPHEGNAPNGGVVTISIGCATRGAAHDTLRPLSAEADQLLYEAKRTGRNRVCSRLTLSRIGTTDETRIELFRGLAIERLRAARLAAGSGELDALAARLAKLLQMPTGFISLYGLDEVELVGRYNLALTSATREDAFCRHTVMSSEPIVVPDLKSDPRFEANPFVACENGMRFYAAAPLSDPRSGVSIGAVCVCDEAPRYAFGAEERNILATFAHLVMHGVD